MVSIIEAQRESESMYLPVVTNRSLSIFSHLVNYPSDRERRRMPYPPSLHTYPPTHTVQWKVLVVDPDSRRLIDNVLEEDAILNENITSTYVHPANQLRRIYPSRLTLRSRH